MHATPAWRRTLLLTAVILLPLAGPVAAESTEPPPGELVPSRDSASGLQEPQEKEREPKAAAGEEEADADKEAATDADAVPSFFATTTVTATGSLEDTFEVAPPVTVLDRETIERRAVDSASDLLRQEVGVDVNGVGPNQARPIIRGQRGLRVLFLENSLRMNNARRQTDFGEIPGLVDLSSVDRVEVVRGPASVLYGSDAIGGVINLITRIPAYYSGPRLGGRFGLRWGSAAGQVRGEASVGGRFGKTAFEVNGSWRDGDDYDAPSGSFGDIRLDRAVPVLDTGLTDRSGSTHVTYQPTERHQLFLRGNVYRADQAGFGFVEPEILGDSQPVRIRILYPFQDFERFTLGYNGTVLDSVVADSLEVQAYHQSNERELVNDIGIDIGPLFPGAPNSSVQADTLNFTDLDTFGLRTEAVKVVGGKHVVTYGIEGFEDDSFNTDSSVTTTTLRFPFPPFEVEDVTTDDKPNAPNASNTSYGLFAQGELALGDRLEVTVGARYQEVKTKAKPTPGWDITGLDFSDDSLVGAVNVLFAVKDYLKLVGGYGTAFRAPNIVERLFNGLTPEGIGFQVLNPDLVSEESDNIDVGIKYRRRNAFFELMLFRNDIDNGIIQFNLSPEEIAQLPQDVQDEIQASGVTFVVQQRNIDRLRSEGIEVSTGYQWGDGFSVGGNYTHLDVTRTVPDRPPTPTGDAISDKFNFFFRWNPPRKRFWVEYRLRRNGEEPTRLDVNDPVPPVGETIPSFTVHTLGAGITLFERGSWQHQLNIVIDNLTDELYAEFSNATFFRPQPERNILVTYRVRW